MRVLRRRVVRGCLFLGMAVLAARTVRAQLIPLLPPIVSDSEEEATPQQSKAAKLIQDDLAAERFDELDQIADGFRRNKTRARGGGWRLHTFYSELLGKPESDDAVKEHIAHLEHWIAFHPESMTPRIAMAQTLHHWAWMARGGGVASTVSDDGWKLLEERVGREKDVLEAAQKLPMCPEWYSEMIATGIALGWERDRIQAIFDEGAKFEPGYFYLYKEYADYLLPKWYGKPGDTAAFAKKEADLVGGDEGDLIYYYVATTVIKRGNGGIPREEMDWARMKRGAYVLDKKFGESRTTTNMFAFMAYQYGDKAVAAPLFASIGERWTHSIWKTAAYYDRARKWAARPGADVTKGPPADPADPK
jgi:hypothetical protein